MTLSVPWHKSQQTLKYQISDLTLARRSLDVLACEVGLVGKQSGVSIQVPPDRPLQPELAGYVIRGLPIDARRPMFESRSNYLVYTPHQYQRYFIDLTLTFEDYQKTFGTKTLSTIRRKVRKFQKKAGGTVDFRAFSQADEMRDFHQAARLISSLTYQERLLDSGLPSDDDFLDELLNKADNDQVRGYILFLDGNPVSYLLLTALDGTLMYRYLGYDPSLGSLSVGTVLHWLALESVFGEPTFKQLDFTEGEGQQKRQFSTGSVQCATVYCLKNTLRNHLLLKAHALVDLLSRQLGRLASAMGLQARVRKLIRSMS